MSPRRRVQLPGLYVLGMILVAAMFTGIGTWLYWVWLIVGWIWELLS